MAYLAEAINKPVNIPAEVASLNDNIISTVLAIALLRVKFAENASAWDLVEEKGLKWLSAQNADIKWDSVINSLRI